MKEYIKFIDFLAANKVDQKFINSDKDHAIEVLNRIFQNANSVVRIYAGSLCGDLPNDTRYIAALSNFIEKGESSLKVLLNKFDEEKFKNSALIKRLAYYKYHGKNIIVKKTTQKAHYINDPERKELHFTIGDNNAYRIETDIHQRTADCNFNDPTITGAILQVFDRMFAKAEEIDLILMFNLKNTEDEHQ